MSFWPPRICSTTPPPEKVLVKRVLRVELQLKLVCAALGLALHLRLHLRRQVAAEAQLTHLHGAFVHHAAFLGLLRNGAFGCLRLRIHCVTGERQEKKFLHKPIVSPNVIAAVRPSC